MKPAAFVYHGARSIDEAVALLASHGDDAKLLAGGQSLVPMMNMRLAQPRHVIDINNIAQGDAIALDGDRLVLGALVRHEAVARSALVRTRCPILAAAAASIGHYAIRTRGTLGGSLAHADPAAQLPLIMTLLDAALEARSVRGSRMVGAAQFFTGVFATALAPDELLTTVQVPCLPTGAGWGFRLMSRRVGDFAIAAAAATVTLDTDGGIDTVRAALGGVEATPVSLGGLGAAQRGHSPDRAWSAALAKSFVAARQPLDDPRVPAVYRRELAEVLLTRALDDAVVRARGGSP
ncbi:MAG: xanthine dehydrogenase family protein subunit M [Proteobacteria bacterium]|nr:xanthine dehydrogenase family protein subunit M [Pseudomonadota bacterium]